MRALVLEASPGLLCIAPQHQPLAQQLDRVRLAGVEVRDKGEGIPLLVPIESFLQPLKSSLTLYQL